MPDLALHKFELAILQPLCVATGTPLHLGRPFGFILSDPKVKRAGLDYWPRLKLTLHDDDAAFFEAMRGRRLWLFDSTGTRSLFDTPFEAGDVLVLGSETRGIDPQRLAQDPARVVRIPQVPGERCLNLSTSAGIALYAALARVT
jgi:tRNA (cytidine/uridine-2'-O-)-methyltransferase